MASYIAEYLNNVEQGLSQPKGTLGDFAHASRLFTSNDMSLAPKVKFLYHVVFNINSEALKGSDFDTRKYGTVVNMLVKNVDLPRFKIDMASPHQYNKKPRIHTKLEYDPVKISFHDDNLGVINSLWNLYYKFYFADSKNPYAFLTNPYAPNAISFNYGLDNANSGVFFNSIVIYQMAKHKYQSYTLVNPRISSWQHDKLSYDSGNDTVEHTLDLVYETVGYDSGDVVPDNPAGFATEYYDHTPSPLQPSATANLGNDLSASTAQTRAITIDQILAGSQSYQNPMANPEYIQSSYSSDNATGGISSTVFPRYSEESTTGSAMPNSGYRMRSSGEILTAWNNPTVADSVTSMAYNGGRLRSGVTDVNVSGRRYDVLTTQEQSILKDTMRNNIELNNYDSISLASRAMASVS